MDVWMCVLMFGTHVLHSTFYQILAVLGWLVAIMPSIGVALLLPLNFLSSLDRFHIVHSAISAQATKRTQGNITP